MNSILTRPHRPNFGGRQLATRCLLLTLTLFAWGRLLWQIDSKPLWWDESLSLQRAEAAWPALLTGAIVMDDGVYELTTRDQHPPLFFALLAVLVRLAGDREIVLRFPSAMAAAVTVPLSWALAHWLARHAVLPPSAPRWTALLVAASPYYLWYGQEARPYMLWTSLTLLSTYRLLRWTEVGETTDPRLRGRAGFAYGITLGLTLATHFFAVLLMPVHALIAYRHGVSGGRGKAFLAAWVLLAVGGGGALWAAWWVLSQPGAGSNLQSIAAAVLVRDIINAYTLGLSVEVHHVWWLDVCAAALALLGMWWGMRSWRRATGYGMVLPLLVAVPVFLLFLINTVQPAYMNARHLSLVSGAYLMLVGAGLGVLWQRSHRLGAGIAVVLMGAMIYSSMRYFSQPMYTKGGDLPKMGTYLSRELQPGDLLLVDPPFATRLFRYYLPLDAIEVGAQQGFDIAWRAAPMLQRSWDETNAELADLKGRYRRIWLVTDGTFAYSDPNRQVEAWLQHNAFQIWNRSYFSPTSYLELALFLPATPISTQMPANGAIFVDAIFGDQIRLRAYGVGTALAPGSAMPVTLYWEPLRPVQQSYKYVLRLERVDRDGRRQEVAITEREPYNGFLPTTWWRPGPIIVEQSEVTSPILSMPDGNYFLTLMLYDANTLERLPVRAPQDEQVAEDGQTLVFPLVLEIAGGPGPGIPSRN